MDNEQNEEIGTDFTKIDISSLFDEAALSEVDFSIVDQKIDYEEYEVDTTHDIKTQKVLMDDVIRFIGEFTNFLEAFKMKSGFDAEFYVNDFGFRFEAREININLTFKSNDFDVLAFFDNFTNEYDNNFDDYLVNFGIITE